MNNPVRSVASAVPRAVAVVPRAASTVPRAVGSLYDRAIDRVLARPFEVTTADEARAVLDDPDAIDMSALADQIQQIAIVVTPIVRRAGLVRKVPGVRRVPWILSLVTIGNVTRSIRQGVREVQLIGSYLAARLQGATGKPPDPALVKRLTVQVYLAPSRKLNLTDTDQRAATGKLLQRWLINGLLGRTSNKAAVRAIGAVERLDIATVS
jgi:hypothetical protein